MIILSGWIKKHKTTIIMIAASIAVLAAAFFLADRPSSKDEGLINTSSSVSAVSQEATEERSAAHSRSYESVISENTSGEALSEPESKQPSRTEAVSSASEKESSAQLSSENNSVQEEPSEQTQSSVYYQPSEQTQSSVYDQPSEQTQSSVYKQPSEQTESSLREQASVNEEASVIPPQSSAAILSQSEKPESEVQPSQSSEKTGENYCTLSISCIVLTDKTDSLKKSKRQLVPADGIILKEVRASFSEGESVFDVTRQVCIENRIPFEFTLTPIYNTAYIEGIYNLYEFDCGSGSGWVYAVNDELPGVGCSDSLLKNGDRIEWMYTCDLGHDAEKLLKERKT